MLTGKRVYDAFSREVQEGLSNIEGRQILVNFLSTITAFEEAGKCFDSGSFLASTQMCRVVMESVVYESVSRGKDIIKLQTKENPQYISEIGFSDGKVFGAPITTDFSEDWWREIKSKAIIKGILTEAECKSIDDNIMEKGNFVAHLAARRDKEGRFTIKQEEAEKY